MKKYRLKKEAVPFFKEKHATSIHDLSTWNELQVDEKALDVVDEAYLTYGHKTSDFSKSLCGWDAKEGSHYLFTIKFPSMKYMEHDKFSNGKVMRKLMDKIQYDVNKFFEDFVNDKLEDEA